MSKSKNNKDKITKGVANDTDKLVAERLRKIRLLKGLSQQQIAQILDVSIQQIQKYEKGTNRLSSGKLYDLIKFLEVPVNYFFEQNAHPQLNIVDNDPNNIPEKEIVALISSFSSIKDAVLRKYLLTTISLISKH